MDTVKILRSVIKQSRETIADQQIELVQLRKDYECVSGLLVKAREHIAALTTENEVFSAEVKSDRDFIFNLATENKQLRIQLRTAIDGEHQPH